MAAVPTPRMPASSSGLDDRDIDDILIHAARWTGELRGARVLVTGATGWFGTWLLDALVALDRTAGLGLRVVAVSRDPDAFLARHPRLATAAPIEWLRGDVRDAHLAIDGTVTHVIHAAAESSTTWSSDSDASMHETIVAGTRNVLAIARRAGARRVLFVSSGAVYGPQPEGVAQLREDHPLSGAGAYATGKREAERLVVDAATARCRTVVARCFAFVGPHMPFDAHFAIGNFIRDAMDAGEIAVRGDGSPRRSYLYMTDLVVWLLTLLCVDAAPTVCNVGSPDAVSIAALARRCVDASGVRKPVRIHGSVSTGGDYVPDVACAANAFALRARVSLDEAIDRTMRWRRRTRDLDGMSKRAPVATIAAETPR